MLFFVVDTENITMSAKVFLMPHHQQQNQKQQQQYHQPSSANKNASLHQQKSSETTYLMSDGDEDPFMDSPASVLGETNNTNNTQQQQQQQQQRKKLQQTSGGDDNDDETSAQNNVGNRTTVSDRGGDYASMVRNKYFDPRITTSATAVPPTAYHSNNHPHFLDEESKASSNMDLSEIFETYETTPSSTPTSAVYQAGASGSLLTPRGDEDNASHDNDDHSHNNAWAQEQRNSRSNKTMMRRSNTPPLTLYSGSAITTPGGTPITPNNNRDPFTTESAGVMSPITSADMIDAMSSSGRNTPTSQMTSDAIAGSIASSTASSVQRSGSSINTSSLLSKHQPLLYSAIGSLEQVNTNSLRILNKRLLTPSKEFSKPGSQSVLIPPVNQHTIFSGQKQPRKSKLAAVSNTDMQRTTPLASNNSNSDTNFESTIGTNNKNPTRKMSGQEVFGVLKKQSFNNSEQKEDPSSIPTEQTQQKKRSNLRTPSNTAGKNKNGKKVSYDAAIKSKKKNSKGPIEMFRPSSDAYTPRIERKRIEYKTAEARTPVQQMASPMGTLQRPNFRDALRRVAMIIHQHIAKIENRFEGQSDTKLATDDGLFKASMRDMFNEDVYRTPTYKCTMVRIPMARPGMSYGLRKIRVMYEIPSETEIYDFAHQLFNSVQLSSECSIVCLIYVERLMEVAKVPLLACTWRPIFLCGLLLASKVWQDLSSWNIEFASVYPQFSLEAINRLELNFLRNVKWDLYISSR